MTDYDAIKNKAKQLWSTFAPFEVVTGLAAPKLIQFSGVKSNDKVLDVGCGTGVVAITAARCGADVDGSDFGNSGHSSIISAEFKPKKVE